MITARRFFTSQASNSVATLTQTVNAGACLGKKPCMHKRKVSPLHDMEERIIVCLESDYLRALDKW